MKILLIIAATLGFVWLFQNYSGDMSSDDKFSIFYYLLLIGLVGSSVLVRFRHNISASAKQAGIWVLIILALVGLYAFRNEFYIVKERIIAELAPSYAKVTPEGTLEFRVSSDGHFRINALVNGQAVRFMVDTGASDVVIPPHIARQIGIDLDKLQYNKIYSTANGQVRGASININTIEISGFRFDNVRASVNEAEMESPLLGMSFLEQLAGYEVSGGVLVLRP